MYLLQWRLLKFLQEANVCHHRSKWRTNKPTNHIRWRRHTQLRVWRVHEWLLVHTEQRKVLRTVKKKCIKWCYGTAGPAPRTFPLNVSTFNCVTLQHFFNCGRAHLHQHVSFLQSIKALPVTVRSLSFRQTSSTFLHIANFSKQTPPPCKTLLISYWTDLL
jgi:hypothetical protein